LNSSSLFQQITHEYSIPIHQWSVQNVVDYCHNDPILQNLENIIKSEDIDGQTLLGLWYRLDQ
jgi:hypothetical protein